MVKLFVLVVVLVLLGASLPGMCGESLAGEDFSVGSSANEVLRLVFTGNEGMSVSELEAVAASELEDFFLSEYPEAKGDDAAYLIESMYRKAGYHFARVEYQIATGHDETVVTFTIHEGPEVQVSNILISGNSVFSDDDLLTFFEGKNQAMLGRGDLLFVDAEIRDAVSDVRDLYTATGYLKVKINPPLYVFTDDKSQVAIRLEIAEGMRIEVGEVVYEGEILEQAKNDLQDLARELSGKAFLVRRKLMLRSAVQEIYGNLGYPDVAVQIKERRQEESPKVDLICFVVSGPQITVAEIEVSGNERTRKEFIIKRLSLQPGDLYTILKKRESFQNLYKTGLFSKVSLSLTQGVLPGKRLLTVTVEEALSREVFLHGGWGSYELLRGSTGFRDKNIFGRGRSFRFEAGGSLKSANIEATVRDPWIFGSNITADFPVFFRSREEPSFTEEEFGASMLLSKKITSDLAVSLRYLYSDTKTKDIIFSAANEPESDYTIASFKLQGTWDNRNDILFPTNGHKVFAAVEIADPSLGSGLSFYRCNFGARKFFQVSAKNILAVRYDTGVILPGRNQVIIPIGERYFNGGENTVRSFLESELGPKDSSGDPLGGMAFNVFSIELRRLLTDNLAASLFADYGNISPNVSPEQEGGEPLVDRHDAIARTLTEYFSDFRPAVGMGLQYLLPVGPARLDFAWNPHQDADRDEDGFTIHFSIGMAF